MGHIVKAPLVIAHDEEGKQVYLYFGTEVPSSIPDDEIERLSDYFESDGEKPKRSRKVAHDESSDSE